MSEPQIYTRKKNADQNRLVCGITLNKIFYFMVYVAIFISILEYLKENGNKKMGKLVEKIIKEIDCLLTFERVFLGRFRR